MTSPEYVYFILTRKTEYRARVNAGCICYMKAYQYNTAIKKDPSKVCVFFIRSHVSLDYDVETSNLELLDEKEAAMLLALPDDKERLKWFKERKTLQTALGLTEGTAVTVEKEGEELRGIIRYIGAKERSTPLSGTVFGIELQDPDKGKGDTDGTYGVRTLFSCPKKCGVFAPFSRVRPLVPSSLSSSIHQPSPQPEEEELMIGDRVMYFVDENICHGMVLNVLEKDGGCFVRISTDKDENGKQGGEIEVPLQSVAKVEVPSETENMDVDTPQAEKHFEDLYLDLSLNCLVEVSVSPGNNLYGIIRWIGDLPDRQEIMAGLELEEDRGTSDGTFKGQRFFRCPPKRALFVKLSSCRPDSRFQIPSANHNEAMHKLKNTDMEMEDDAEKLETVPPVCTEQVNQVLIGRMKGIQGHCNSCYMDAALFSLFSCSSVLDSMLFISTKPQDALIQSTLLYDIVNPLRKKGFVDCQHIMKLRQQLQKHGYSHSFTTDEKDPEEFLTVIMHHILALDPLLKLSAGSKVQESYCYQIFLDQNHSLVLPTVQQLLEHSFRSAGLKLAEAPSCLILQMPRFGKKFKMFDKIIPSLELDITGLLSEGPQQCIICGNLAEEECNDCFEDPVFSRSGFKIFCRMCSQQVHSHPQRMSHKRTDLDIPKGYMNRGTAHALPKEKLELFAVLCIETSHYVSFIKYGPNQEDWLFFDSMADREGESDGFNIPEVQPCPEVAMYLKMSPSELANQVPRDMKGVAKRLFCDAYMYLYQNTNMCLYR